MVVNDWEVALGNISDNAFFQNKETEKKYVHAFLSRLFTTKIRSKSLQPNGAGNRNIAIALNCDQIALFDRYDVKAPFNLLAVNSIIYRGTRICTCDGLVPRPGESVQLQSQETADCLVHYFTLPTTTGEPHLNYSICC